ncbi:hypothetical protein CORC01_10977 [Colletotrichum orchidophilum]|uniref:CCHC-type domain-containing protein n=1 Tax=Colletotrichum orchidophilum TaxID=1209926 RepID=A0A1G4AX66_9PEZI|nr:uncharacterized protein CORC01_10977 [Colletotrichum orchidophilum]OHE93750.1 hypothetical protein CORC01_10977 [Colletotrichum orchidophilum]
MPPTANLPTPAAGDIFTHNGNLKVSNAAANIFLVYDCDSNDAGRLPSSLTVDFVMGNVYVIDSSLFGHWGSNRIFGNLVKGLGLQLEGRLEGDQYIDTVYDDVVCVVEKQSPTCCSFGTVAGNLITIADLTAPGGNNHHQHHSVSTNYVHGCHLLESHLSYGGGLQRAYSAWASMTFPAAKPSSLPTNPIPSNTQRSTSGTGVSVEASSTNHHETLGLRNAEREVKQLRRVVDKLFSRIILGQTTAMTEQGMLEEPSSQAQQTSGGPENQLSGVCDSDYQRMMCANCCRAGHKAKDCIGPVDTDGFISACPICNVRNHTISSCPKITGAKKSVRKSIEFLYLVERRQNKPPMKSRTCWVAAWAAKGCPRIQLPHTKEFARKLLLGKICSGTYPDWRTYDYSPPCLQRVRTDPTLLRDPSTMYESGRPCRLFPGTQGTITVNGFETVRAKMHRLGIELHPDVPNPSHANHTKKAKRKQAARNSVQEADPGVKIEGGDASRFATGANCTIVQRHIPTLPSKPAFNTATSVNVKQETTV